MMDAKIVWAAPAGGSGVLDRSGNASVFLPPLPPPDTIAWSHLAGRTPTHAASSASSTPVDHCDVISHPLLQLPSSVLLLLKSPSVLRPFALRRFQRPITIGRERAGKCAAGGSSTCSPLFTPHAFLSLCVFVPATRTHIHSIDQPLFTHTNTHTHKKRNAKTKNGHHFAVTCEVGKRGVTPTASEFGRTACSLCSQQYRYYPVTSSIGDWQPWDARCRRVPRAITEALFFWLPHTTVPGWFQHRGGRMCCVRDAARLSRNPHWGFFSLLNHCRSQVNYEPARPGAFSSSAKATSVSS